MMTCLVALLALRPNAQPTHLKLAEELVAAIKPENTSYRHTDSEVVWPGADQPAISRTDCSGLWNALISKAYPQITSERLEGWLGKKHPRAEDYFAVMQDGIAFNVRKRIETVRPGDFIAIRYEAGADNTGHTMIVERSPQPLLPPSSPSVDQTKQYTVLVIDQTSTPHGEGDTRGKGTGLGEGTIRIYANPDGSFAGHAWSLSAKAKFRPMSLRPMVIAELDVSRIPKIEATKKPR